MSPHGVALDFLRNQLELFYKAKSVRIMSRMDLFPMFRQIAHCNDFDIFDPDIQLTSPHRKMRVVGFMVIS